MLQSRAISYAINTIEDYLETPNSIDALSILGTALMNCNQNLDVYKSKSELEYQFIDVIEMGGKYIRMWIRYYKDENRDTFVEVIRKYAYECMKYGHENNNEIIIKLGKLLDLYV